VNEPTSFRAAAFAINMTPEDLQILNPELQRDVTPPDCANYPLNLPPNSKDLFTKNITLARIEYPAVVSRPVQTARSYSHSYYARSRSPASPAAAALPSTPKASPKHLNYAKATPTTKPPPANPYAQKGRGSEAVQASMFGKVEATASPKSGSKKPGEAHLAKKGGPAAKGTGKNKTAKKSNSSASKTKEKYSKAKSEALFASAAN
jgi:hypothetical protein